MKGLDNIKKIKSPKASPKSRKNKSYEKFLRGSNETNVINKDKKVIKVQRKNNSPKKISPQRVVKDIRDINDIERKMIQMKDNKNNIKVPTQNIIPKKEIPKPVIKNPSKKIGSENVPKKEPIYNGPQINTNHYKPKKVGKVDKANKVDKVKKVRISDIDVREKRSDEDLTENKKKLADKKQVTKPTTRPTTKPTNKPRRSLTRNTKSKKNIRPNNRSKNTRSQTNRKISIRNKNLDEKDIKNVSLKMRKIRNTKKDEIKKELARQGVKVSGKSDRLLKDIYLYSKMCNINITHEK